MIVLRVPAVPIVARVVLVLVGVGVGVGAVSVVVVGRHRWAPAAGCYGRARAEGYEPLD